MTVQEAIDIIRARANDTDAQVFVNAELIHYINFGVVAVINKMIEAGNPICVNTVAISTGAGANIPDDFHSVAPGEPCYIANGKLFANEATTTPRTVRYFASKPFVSNVSDKIPLPDAYAIGAVNAALMMAGMRIGKDVNQEANANMMSLNLRALGELPIGGMGFPMGGGGGGGSVDKGQP